MVIHTAQGGLGHKSVYQFPPAPNTAAFRDLLIFEERLKQNAARLKNRKRKYQAFLICLSTFILYMAYMVLRGAPSEHTFIYYSRIGFLWIGCMMLFLFFASGYYADCIRTANKFMPQANRSLRTFNMQLNMPRTPWPFSWLPAWFSPNASATSDGSTSPARAPSEPYVYRVPSPSELRHARSLHRRNRTIKMPPTQNERGEIIFSSRVDAEFRDGYERYRRAFERKRREKLEAQQQAQPSIWSSWSFLSKEAP